MTDLSSNSSNKGTAKSTKPVAAAASATGSDSKAAKPAEKEKKSASPSNIEICDSHLESMSFLMNYIYTSEVDKSTINKQTNKRHNFFSQNKQN